MDVVNRMMEEVAGTINVDTRGGEGARFEVVPRHIYGLNCNSESMAGGVLMGDGNVARIIDVYRMHNEFTAPALV